MKHLKLYITAALAIIAANAWAQDTLAAGNKRILVTEENNRTKVRVYSVEPNGREHEQKLVFEGHYGSNLSYERRERDGYLHIPIPFRRRSFNPHWDGFSIGFANLSRPNLEGLAEMPDGVELVADESLEYNLQLFEKGVPLGRQSNFIIVFGAGMRWSRYVQSGNLVFAGVDGRTQLCPTERDVIASRLNLTSIVIPIIIECQSNGFFFSAGVEGVFKTASSAKLEYRNERGKKRTETVEKRLNLRPVSFDILLQTGFNHFGVYARYSPLSLFNAGKGPDVYPIALGAQWHF
ncbi:MAG: PorT family protein [Tannerellaceae bacterium]|jgi:hypothetical protein|nr:PorT family protein [Tannerellaceae bacterium]